MDSSQMADQPALYVPFIVLVVGVVGFIIVFELCLHVHMVVARPVFKRAEISDESNINSEVKVHLHLISSYCRNSKTVAEGNFTLICVINKKSSFKTLNYYIHRNAPEDIYCKFQLNGSSHQWNCEPKNVTFDPEIVTDDTLQLVFPKITHEDITTWYCQADYKYELGGKENHDRTKKESFDLGRYCAGKSDKYPPVTTSAAPPSDSGDNKKSSRIVPVVVICLVAVCITVGICIYITRRVSRQYNSTTSGVPSNMGNENVLLQAFWRIVEDTEEDNGD